MRLVSSVLAVLLLVPGWSGAERLPLLGDDARITAHPVAMDRMDPTRRRLGVLTYLGGVELRSPDPVFGGFSALAVRGEQFTMLSDGGGFARFSMDAAWRIRDARFGQIPDGPGYGWQTRDRDSESMAVDPDTGAIWVGFERQNEIWRYTRDFARVSGRAAPFAMRRWPDNGGAETLIRLRDGGFVAIAESGSVRVTRGPAKGRRGRGGVRFLGDPTQAPNKAFGFVFRPPAGYSATDGVELPDGRLLILLRAATFPAGFTARLSIVDADAIRPGAMVEGREIARFEGSTQRDNMEALAITNDEKDTILWIASDDNRTWWLQRTLLLKFRLDLPPR